MRLPRVTSSRVSASCRTRLSRLSSRKGGGQSRSLAYQDPLFGVLGLKAQLARTSPLRARNEAVAFDRRPVHSVPRVLTRERAGPQIRRGDPPNLSISISGGKATNQDSPSNGERSGKSSSRQSLVLIASELWPAEADAPDATSSKLTWKGTSERVIAPCVAKLPMAATVFGESGCLGVQPKVGGKLHLKPNNGTRPIANKYHEGKVKSTLERELKRPRNRWEGNACSRTGSRRVQGTARSRACRRHPRGRLCVLAARIPGLSAARAGQVRWVPVDEHASGR